MKVVVVYESLYGNTAMVAEAIASGMKPAHEVQLVGVDHVSADDLRGVDLVVAGGPTHVHGMSTGLSRKSGAEEMDADEGQEPATDPEAGIRTWLHHVEEVDGVAAAAFDTRLDKARAITGSAAKVVARRLKRHGFRVVAEPESFFVEDSEGPLEDGEIERATEWGAAVAKAAVSDTHIVDV